MWPSGRIGEALHPTFQIFTFWNWLWRTITTADGTHWSSMFRRFKELVSYFPMSPISISTSISQPYHQQSSTVLTLSCSDDYSSPLFSSLDSSSMASHLPCFVGLNSTKNCFAVHITLFTTGSHLLIHSIRPANPENQSNQRWKTSTARFSDSRLTKSKLRSYF